MSGVIPTFYAASITLSPREIRIHKMDSIAPRSGTSWTPTTSRRLGMTRPCPCLAGIGLRWDVEQKSGEDSGQAGIDKPVVVRYSIKTTWRKKIALVFSEVFWVGRLKG